MNSNDIQLVPRNLQQPLVQQDVMESELYDPHSQDIIHQDLGFAIKQAKKICKGFIYITLLKVLISSIIAIKGYDCSAPEQIWLIIMLGYDCIYVLHNLSIIRFLPRTPVRFLLIQYDPTDPEYQDTNLSGFIIGQCLQHYYAPVNGVTAISSCEHHFRCIGAVAELLRVVYILLFIFGNIFIYIGLANFDTFDSAVFVVYIGLGYLYLFIPLLLCVSWPCLVIGVFCLQLRQANDEAVAAERRKPLQEKLFKKYLIAKKYKNVMPEESEQKYQLNSLNSDQCTICYVEYDRNQNIIQLPCNQGHYFHNECVQRWLAINGTCPICRQNIEKLLIKDNK